MNTGAPVGDQEQIVDPYPSPGPITVVVFNDHPVFRTSLPWKMDAGSNLQVIADVPSRHEAVKLINELSPSVVVAELRIGDGNSEGIESISELAAHAKTLPIIVTSEHGSKSFLAQLVGAGATAVVQKSSGTRALVDAILHSVAAARSSKQSDTSAA